MSADCIEHSQKGDKGGYARTKVNGRNTTMHRVVYCKYNMVSLSDIDGLVVRHKCDNGRCINPEHLEIGTCFDNALDKKSRGRDAVGESHGQSKLHDRDVIEIRSRYKSKRNGDDLSSLSSAYGVSISTISRIINGKIWTHI